MIFVKKPKALKAALMIAALMAVVLLTQAQVFQAPPRMSHPPAGGVMILPQVEAEVFRLTNEIRLRYGFTPLAREETLAAMARAHCADMLQRRFFGHLNPDGLAPKHRVMPSYPWQILRLGENIWKAFDLDANNPAALARTIVDTWMASPGHRDNIFCPDFTHLGVAVAIRGQDMRAAQLFVKLKND